MTAGDTARKDRESRDERVLLNGTMRHEVKTYNRPLASKGLAPILVAEWLEHPVKSRHALLSRPPCGVPVTTGGLELIPRSDEAHHVGIDRVVE